jgi:DNA-binding IclR family transcriptional regulator
MRAAQPIMRALVDQTEGDALLANLYGDQVMNVHREDGPKPAVISYDRGRPHPLFRGSTSKAVLPFLPRAQLKRIYGAHAEDCRRAGLGSTWEEFVAALAPIRRSGYVIGHGELDPHVIGIAAPIFADEKRVFGSLTLILSKSRYDLLDKERILGALLDASRRITSALGRLSGSQ